MKSVIIKTARCSDDNCSCGCFRITETDKPGKYFVNDEHGNAVIMTKNQIVFVRDIAKEGHLEGSHEGVCVTRVPENGAAKEFVISVVGEGKIYGSLESFSRSPVRRM